MTASAPYRAPGALLRDLGISEPEEIDVEAIAEYCGATVVYEPIEGCAARIIGLGGRAVITVRNDSEVGRRRFSAAHELGHWMCDRGEVAFVCTAAAVAKAWRRESPERRANRFAVDLLLPEPMFRPLCRDSEMTLSAARPLADRFSTSLTATAISPTPLQSGA